MKHVKLFEYFNPEDEKNPPSGFRKFPGSGNNFKVEIKFDSENPDVAYGGIAVGIDRDARYAAFAALDAAWNYVVSGETEVSPRKKGQALVDMYGMGYEDRSKELNDIVIDIIESDHIESDIFGDHGTTSNATVSISKTNESPASYIKDDYTEEY